MLKRMLVILACLLLLSCGLKKYTYDIHTPVTNIKYSGVRSSHYGIRPFPEARVWQKAISKISDEFRGSQPCAIWIVGTIDKNNPSSCHLEFPSEGEEYANICFNRMDKHEPYLTYFDQHRIKVYLQVEPAYGDLEILIDLVLNRYKHHPCVLGFGVDVEWYKGTGKAGWGDKVNDRLARLWECRVKDHNSQYQLFLKHWDRRWMPPNYRGDIIFVDDSQMLNGLNAMVHEFVHYWANYFKPNMVFFQIGYASDRQWWGQLHNPPRDIGQVIAQNVMQPCGIFWVDFTLRESILKEK